MNPYYIDFGNMTEKEMEQWVRKYSNMLESASQLERIEYQRGWEDCMRTYTDYPQTGHDLVFCGAAHGMDWVCGCGEVAGIHVSWENMQVYMCEGCWDIWDGDEREKEKALET